MNTEPEKMQDGNEFQQTLKRYEEMMRLNVRYFFDVEEFENIIDYYIDIRNFTFANKAIELGLAQHPGSFELMVKYVHLYLESGNPSKAVEMLNKLPDFEKENPEYYLLKGTALAQLGKNREAEKNFDIALEKTTDDKVEILMNISLAFESSNNFKQSVKYLKLAHEEDNTDLHVLYDLAYYYERMKMLEESVNYYNKYLDIDPFAENVWFNLGVVYYKMNRYSDALKAYDYAITINPKYASAYYNKANIYANEGEYSTAIEVYKEFIELEPNHIPSYCFLGECYEEIGKYKDSLDVFRHLISIDNTAPEGWYGAGMAYMFLEDYKNAQSYILKAIDFDRDNEDYWFSLGDVYERSSRFNEAIKCYKKVTSIDHKDREAWVRQASIQVKQDNPRQALKTLREAFRWNMNCQDIVYMLSAVYFILNDFPAGLKFLEKAVGMGEGGMKLFLEIYPEAKTNQTIRQVLNIIS